MAAAGQVARATQRGGEVFRAWSPFLVLTALISLWGIPQVKAALTGHYEGTNGLLKLVNAIGVHLTFMPSVPGLNNQILNPSGQPIAAVYKLELLGAAGTAILLAAVVTKFIIGISWKDWARTFVETLNELKFPIITIASVVGFAYIANSSGMSTTLGMALAKTGPLFPFFSPILGWLGVFITGSDTSSNLLFGNLQKRDGDIDWHGSGAGVGGQLIRRRCRENDFAAIDRCRLCGRRFDRQRIRLVSLHGQT